MSGVDDNARILWLLGVKFPEPPCAPPCDDEYCGACGSAECPHGEPLHRHHDGCPACAQ